jgi:hypothetical protein
MVQKTKLVMSTDHRMGAFLMLWENQVDGRPVVLRGDVDVLTINQIWGGTKK